MKLKKILKFIAIAFTLNYIHENIALPFENKFKIELSFVFGDCFHDNKWIKFEFNCLACSIPSCIYLF